MKKLGVFIIHGMGDPDPGFAEGLIQRLRGRLGAAAPDVEFEKCYWSPILQKYQDVVWQRLLESNTMDAKSMRRFVVSALGDPTSYLSGFFKADRRAYDDVHECVRDSLARLAGKLGNADAKPLMVLAHSLGSVIMSNYYWDTNHGSGIGKTPFERLETLTSFITYGSNIPLFLPPVEKITCIRFPSPDLPLHLRQEARWQNVFDPDDILGYPLNTIWDDRQGTVIEDITINAGIWPVSETPFSHTAYDRDGDFLDLVGERMKALLAIPQPAALDPAVVASVVRG